MLWAVPGLGSWRLPAGFSRLELPCLLKKNWLTSCSSAMASEKLLVFYPPGETQCLLTLRSK